MAWSYTNVPGVTNVNGLKTAYPFSNFGTRELAFYLVDGTGIETTPTIVNSKFSQVIRGVQSVAEIFYVGTPTADGVIVAIAADTNEGTTSDNDNGQTLKQAIDAATGGDFTVTAKAVTGNAFV